VNKPPGHKSEGKNTGSAWIREIDYLRGFAIISVFLLHAVSQFGPIINTSLNFSNVPFFYFLFSPFLEFGVALFFFISGFVLSRKYYGSFSIRHFYLRRAKSIIIPYVIFSLLYITFPFFTQSSFNLNRAVFSLLTASGNIILWFIFVIMMFYLSYPLIIRLYAYFEDRKKTGALLLLVFLVSSFSSTFALKYNFDLFQSFRSENLLSVYFSYLLLFTSSSFFFVAGIYSGRNLKYLRERMHPIAQHRKIIFLLPVAFGCIISIFLSWESLTLGEMAFYIGDYSGMSAMPIFHIFVFAALDLVSFLLILAALFVISIYMTEKKNPLSVGIGSLGKYSFGIYLIHVLFLELLYKAFLSIGIASSLWLSLPLLIFAGLALSYTSIYLIGRLPYSELVIGRTQKTARS